MNTALLHLVRPSHWTKNFLILLPAALAHRAPEPELLGGLALALLAFSFGASAGYIANDLLDLEADRAHPTKRYRPMASGAVSPSAGVALGALLLGLALVLAWWVSAGFLALLVGYVALSATYSRWLKTVAVVDIFVLASFYSVRLFAGGLAAGVPLSSWLLSFSVFFFLSLGVLKRYTEIRMAPDPSGSTTTRRGPLRRGYEHGDETFLLVLGLGTGAVAGLILALYLDSPEVTRLYVRPELLWFVVPLVLFWLTRFWFLSHRGLLRDDPIFTSLRDPVSYGVGIVVLVLMLFASR